MIRLRLPAIAWMSLTWCAYHAAGHSDLLPKTIRTICIPAFSNITTRYKRTHRLAQSESRACRLWMAADSFRLAGENVLAVAREIL